MNRLLIFDYNLESKKAFTADKSVIEHAHSTLKLSKGQNVLLALANYGLASSTVSEISESGIAFEIEEVTKKPKGNYHIEVAASRPPTMKKVLEHGTSLGVSHFDVFKADLSDKSYLQSQVFKKESLEKLTSLGVSQGKNLCHLPEVNISERKPSNENFQKYILSPHGDKTLATENIDFSQEISLLIGPERGFTMAEEKKWKEAGYKPILISEQTLRVEIALFVALGQLEMLRLSR